jgi:hypothetical protein
LPQRQFEPRPDRFVDPIGRDVTPQWETRATVIINGQMVSVDRVLSFSATKPGFGAWSFGVRNWQEEGQRHGFVIHDRGGSVIFPFTMIGDIPYLGHAVNTRELANHDREPVHEAARGFHTSDDDTNPFETARAEVLEELGLEADGFRLIDMTEELGLTGGTNWNTTFVDSGDGNGVSHLLLEIPPSLLEPDGYLYRFRPGVLKANPGTPDLKAIGERVLSTEFSPFPGPGTPDQFTLSARQLFIEYMLACGRLEMRWS